MSTNELLHAATLLSQLLTFLHFPNITAALSFFNEIYLVVNITPTVMHESV